MSEAFQLAFEKYSRAVLQEAVSFTDGDPRLGKIWVYTILSKGTIEPTWYFQVGEGFLSAQSYAERLDPELDHSDLVRESMDSQLAFVGPAADEPGEVPCRIVIEYDPNAGSMSSQWDYAAELGLDEADPGRKTRDAWIIEHGGEPIFE